MTEPRPRLVYVLPDLSEAGADHLAHVPPLLRRIAERVELAVYAERGEGRADVRGVREVYRQRHGHGASAHRLLETYRYARHMIARGYDRFFVRISVPAAVAILAAGRAGRARVYYWTCGLDWRQPGPRPLSRLLRESLIERPAFRCVLRHAYRVVTGPERMVRYYRDHLRVPEERLTLLYNDIELSRFAGGPPPERVAEVRSELGATGKTPLLLFVHHLSRRKGTQVLPEIARRVLMARPEATFAVIGEGPSGAELAASVAPFGARFRLLGRVANRDLDPYWAAADLLLLPSEEEGFPRVLLEAMAAGLPCVATDVGGVLDILPAEAHRWVVRQGDAASFAQAILDALSNPAGRAAVRAAQLSHVVRFSTERVAEMFVNAICGVES